MVLAFSSGNVADTGKPGLTSPQARVQSSGESEVARASSAVSKNLETSRVETRRAVEATAESQKPKSLPPSLQAVIDKNRDISFSDRKSAELPAKELVQNLEQKKIAEQKAVAKAEQKSPAQLEAQERIETKVQEKVIEERQAAREEKPPERVNDGQAPVRLEAQRAYLDRVQAQRAYRKAAEHEVQVSAERAKSAAAA